MSLKLLSCNQWVHLQSPVSFLPTAKGSRTEVAPRYFNPPKSIQLKRLSPSLCFPMDQKSVHEGAFGVGQKDGVIIVDHGSRRKESNILLNEFVLMFKSRTGYPIVEPAHMELAEPSIKDAFDLCVQQGANRVIISPFFLFPGRHWHQDIPVLAGAAALEHPGINYLVTAPLGLHELLVDVVKDRIDYCLSHVAGQVEECAVCAGTGRCKFKVQNSEM
ncbi:sirohydrochlorin ferrochelatase, chloroplastic [Beta vulgaris subsp. vulgaris]|uniref:sirohydrochlorin ferrochelatase, chloroplastic n=1 Tax=Beta vulgaris subsp. vulgaris TaxID=3555 RepID=UPI002036DB13|nr:sirohydrochlorin ferrochelatase, chloroplastic [Beta vulgaris subsp. vulgaris]XP_010670855.2 sirohydrochlorin ferrochelatase, chloroplastic [Beta vulgaris subsp. vulgaris]XP_010670856.2 sirohydrochlorin ferrochelatase, chloroplastic [Beta vulgaris subsp. vulgaris]XP_010670859.2 sirohydrochlorin ferrochelatase, chloroplastic [Beta vulgaris subsp. vulgaris]XP_048494020.1 sirohydrochlorin ferrochelatase, chloroplastic [Beta vulgaris subsp. vulgaris]XP_048494021.1 sirohydrochlorin ferrochelatas